MTRSLAWKLTLAFLLLALTVALLVAVFIRLFSAEQLDRLIVEQQRSQFREFLVAYYQRNGSWAGVRERLFEASLPPFPEPGQPGLDPNRPPQPRLDRRELFSLADAQGVIVIPRPDWPIGRRVPPEIMAQGEPVEVGGRVVGTILTAPLPPDLNREETAYLQRTNLALMLAGGGAVLVALVVGILLARNLTHPLRALTRAAHRMAGGELEQAVPVRSADEIGELAAAFNQMSRELARANRSRRQMTADIAHELRTPLTVIAGYIEAMRDGVLAATPERLSVIYIEIERLQQLVGDLRTLTQAEAGELKLNRQPLPPREILQAALAAFEHQVGQKQVRLELKVADSLPTILVDEIRLGQVLGNLIGNAMRYTPAEGLIILGAAQAGDRVRLTVQDTGQGIAPEDLPFVFDRFYRADKSRAESIERNERSESGLGLAIAKAIVEAHGGTIEIQSVLGRGATVSILLPAAAP